MFGNNVDVTGGAGPQLFARGLKKVATWHLAFDFSQKFQNLNKWKFLAAIYRGGGSL